MEVTHEKSFPFSPKHLSKDLPILSAQSTNEVEDLVKVDGLIQPHSIDVWSKNKMDLFFSKVSTVIAIFTAYECQHITQQFLCLTSEIFGGDETTCDRSW